MWCVYKCWCMRALTRSSVSTNERLFFYFLLFKSLISQWQWVASSMYEPSKCCPFAHPSWFVMQQEKNLWNSECFRIASNECERIEWRMIHVKWWWTSATSSNGLGASVHRKKNFSCDGIFQCIRAKERWNASRNIPWITHHPAICMVFFFFFLSLFLHQMHFMRVTLRHSKGNAVALMMNIFYAVFGVGVMYAYNALYRSCKVPLLEYAQKEKSFQQNECRNLDKKLRHMNQSTAEGCSRHHDDDYNDGVFYSCKLDVRCNDAVILYSKMRRPVLITWKRWFRTHA